MLAESSTRSVRKVSVLLFSCENLVDSNEAHSHEVTLNLHTHDYTFPCLSIVSVDGKQHLSELVFSVLVDFHCAPWVPITGAYNHQRVLQGCPLPPTWCCAVQETGVAVNRRLAPPTRQCSSTFLALDSDFFGKKRDFWLFPKLKGPLKGKRFQTRGHYDCNDSQAKHHSERGFLGMFPTMAEKCVESQADYFEGD